MFVRGHRSLGVAAIVAAGAAALLIPGSVHASGSSVVITVPATSGPAGRAGSTGFVDSGFNLNGSDSIQVAGSGTACSNTSQCNGPDGFPGATSCINSAYPCPAPGLPAYSLIAQVGSGPWQLVGTGPTTLTGTGEVFFAYNDGIYSDNFAAFTATVTYTPTYDICPLYDSTKGVHQGATIPIKFYLCDAGGNDLSSPSITVHVTGITRTTTATDGVVDDSGAANPDNDFRFDPTLGPSGGYIFNLSTKPLSAGTWSLAFTAGGDIYSGDTYTLTFQVN